MERKESCNAKAGEDEQSAKHDSESGNWLRAGAQDGAATEREPGKISGRAAEVTNGKLSVTTPEGKVLTGKIISAEETDAFPDGSMLLYSSISSGPLPSPEILGSYPDDIAERIVRCYEAFTSDESIRQDTYLKQRIKFEFIGLFFGIAAFVLCGAASFVLFLKGVPVGGVTLMSPVVIGLLRVAISWGKTTSKDEDD